MSMPGQNRISSLADQQLTPGKGMQIVWFKRDLRIHDHDALTMALSYGDVIPVYILEPDLWQQPDMSHRQYIFLMDCLQELDDALVGIGSKLIIKVGNAVDVLTSLAGENRISGLWSHQETWNGWTHARDKQVQKWVNNQDIMWHQPVQNGVLRRLGNRNGWAERWYHQMGRELLLAPLCLRTKDVQSDILPTANELNLADDGCIHRQKGGRKQALALLNSFLYQRGEGYTKEMSSPVTAYDSCSRLSPYIAFGCISMREVLHAADDRAAEIKEMPRGTKGSWGSAIRSFSSRLRWHCHFIQKLEDEPSIEYNNMHSAYDGLRENDFNEAFFTAWKEGKTGYPMVDACMRALVQTGWVNFRMRAMLMSFASYHLWLHWREPSLFLARMFTDYEPGIHYAQAQMQSGTTGINSIRIYNPIKQGIDQDPDGIFIREWVPELADMPAKYIHQPWRHESLMNGYPMPIVDEKTARKFAADKIYRLRKDSTHQTEAGQIVEKHGSRKPMSKRKIKNTTTLKPLITKAQQELPL
jgi:deoxyribodipyrimidine photo-lyase